MKKIEIDATIMTSVIRDHVEQSLTINQLVDKYGIGRRVLIKALIERGIEPKLRATILRDAHPQLKDKNILFNLYSQLGSLDAVARSIGTSTQAVKAAFKQLGLKPLSFKESCARRRLVIPELENEGWLRHEYEFKCISVNGIAERLGISCTVVRRYMERYGIQPRTLDEQNLYREKQDEVNAKLARNLRSRLSLALKNHQKTGSAVANLGCSIDELRVYLESKFYPNPSTGVPMSWDNYGKDGWELDHIFPLSKMNLSDPKEFNYACSYNNLQPLWRQHNRQKLNKVLPNIIPFPRVPLYIVTGLSGSGKSWICNQLLNACSYVSYDKEVKANHSALMIKCAMEGRPILYDPTRKAKQAYNIYKDHFDVKLLVIDEELDVVKQRLVMRGSKRLDKIEEAYRKNRNLKKHAHFSGTSQEVLEFLQRELDGLRYPLSNQQLEDETTQHQISYISDTIE